LHTLEAGAWLPGVQSAISGVLAFVVVLAVALSGRWRSAFTWSVVAGVVASGLTWLYLVRHWLSLTGLERLTGLDLDNDGIIGEPKNAESSIQEIRVRVSEVTEGGNYKESIYALPLDSGQLSALAAGMAEGLPLAESAWCGRGRPFSQREFRTLRAELTRRGLVALANPKDARQGYILTVAGRHVMAGIIESCLPSPTEQV